MAEPPIPSRSFTVVPVSNPKKSFIDFQNDVTLADVDLAWAEGYRSVEHLKRYTTLGMATDQGKLSNMAALGRLAEKQGVAIPEAGLTTFRPPYTPVTMGLLAGAGAKDGGAHVRRLALYDVHAAKNPIWQPLGYWFRPRAYPVNGETLAQAALREAKAVRSNVGMTDVSTLAKFESSGPDAAAFLEIICATTVSKLAIGRGRYTFMLREDGFVFDDGTVWRLGRKPLSADQLHGRRGPDGDAYLLCPPISLPASARLRGQCAGTLCRDCGRRAECQKRCWQN